MNDGSSCGRPYDIMSFRRKIGKIEIESEEDVLRVRKQIIIIYDPYGCFKTNCPLKNVRVARIYT